MLESNEIKRQFGENLFNIRTSMKLTQDQLAEMIDSNQSTISEIESGASNAKLVTLWRIINTLAVRHNAPKDIADRLFSKKGGD